MSSGRCFVVFNESENLFEIIVWTYSGGGRYPARLAIEFSKFNFE